MQPRASQAIPTAFYGLVRVPYRGFHANLPSRSVHCLLCVPSTPLRPWTRTVYDWLELRRCALCWDSSSPLSRTCLSSLGSCSGSRGDHLRLASCVLQIRSWNRDSSFRRLRRSSSDAHDVRRSSLFERAGDHRCSRRHDNPCVRVGWFSRFTHKDRYPRSADHRRDTENKE